MVVVLMVVEVLYSRDDDEVLCELCASYMSYI